MHTARHRFWYVHRAMFGKWTSRTDIQSNQSAQYLDIGTETKDSVEAQVFRHTDKALFDKIKYVRIQQFGQ